MTGPLVPAAARPDDRTARFEDAFEAHHRRVLAYALRRCPTAADAEDAVSETFTVAWRRIGDLPPTETALPWLLAVARRILANRHRSERRFAGLLDRLKGQPRPSVGPVPTSPAAEALGRLRPDDQELLRLLAWDGLSQAETGLVLGITANAVAIRLHRARKRFADELAKGPGMVRTLPLVKGDPSRERTT